MSIHIYALRVLLRCAACVRFDELFVRHYFLDAVLTLGALVIYLRFFFQVGK